MLSTLETKLVDQEIGLRGQQPVQIIVKPVMKPSVDNKSELLRNANIVLLVFSALT
jgi:hypothetical protein